MSKQPKWTEGPWIIDPQHSAPRDVYVRLNDGDDELLASAYEMEDGGGAKGEANARLISAAPELYAQLVLILDELEHTQLDNGSEEAFQRRYPDAFAALAKARGDA